MAVSPASPPASASVSRSPSLSLSPSFKALGCLSPHVASPFTLSSSFNHVDDALDRFGVASLGKSFERSQIRPACPSTESHVNTFHSGYATGQRLAGQRGIVCCQSGGGNVRKTCYSILSVHQSASPKEIRLAYRKLALQFHPDVAPLHQLDSASKLFSQINEAYAILSDPQRRKCYDLELGITAPTSTAVEYATARKYTNMANGRVYPSMNSFYREWRGTRN